MKRKGWPEQTARAIEEAVDRTLAARVFTTDLGGNAKTVDVTQAVLQFIRRQKVRVGLVRFTYRDVAFARPDPQCCSVYRPRTRSKRDRNCVSFSPPLMTSCLVPLCPNISRSRMPTRSFLMKLCPVGVATSTARNCT